MLHLKGEISRGDHHVLLHYQNPRPFGEWKTMKLVDILAKTKEDASLIAVSCQLTGHIQHNFGLRRLFRPDVTVDTLANRLVTHMSKAQDTFSLASLKPTLAYDGSGDNRFVVKLPPQTVLVTEGNGFFFHLIGFSPEQVQSYPKGLYGLGNNTDEEVTIRAEEACPPRMVLTDLFFSLDSCAHLEESQLEAQGEGNFDLAFLREMDGREAMSQAQLLQVDSPSHLAQEISKLLRQIEAKLGLFPGILAVQVAGEALTFFVRTERTVDMTVGLTFNDSLAKILGTTKAHTMKLWAGENPPSSGIRKGEFVTGAVQKIETNLLERLFPLLLRGSSGLRGSSLSYVAGEGAVAALAYITGDGEVIGVPVPVGEFDSSVEIAFYRRDLTELSFSEDTVVLAHFRLLA